MFDIKQALKDLPRKPGVYIMRDESDAIIYVGKAVNLHNRVRSYFQTGASANYKARHMAKYITHFSYTVTDSEMEAFILENALIKRHCPKYNIRLKDDKAYPYIRITIHERLPRILFARQRGKDRAKYFGPFRSGERVREILNMLHKLWPIRRCTKIFPRDFNKGRPCLNHHIGQCRAPCNKLFDEETYRQYITEAERFIQGKTTPVVSRLKQEMAAAAEEMQFERAAEIRDTLAMLGELSEKQKIDTGGDDRDVIALARDNADALVEIFFVRDGKMAGSEHFMMEPDAHAADGEILAAFLKQFYSEAAYIPKELSLISAPAEKDAIAAWLSHLAERQVQIHVPQKGEKRDMVKLAQTNAQLTLAQFGAHVRNELERNRRALHEITDALGFEARLTRIEALDISNTQGFESVGSMIVFEDGKAKRSDYRKFKLKGVVGPDDYAGIEEVLTRRLTRYRQNHTAFSKLPDIIFVDGGKGQISAAKKALATLGMDIPVCGMVKDERHRTRGLLFEGKEAPLPRTSEGFKLVTRIQDEVHRFALEYHRKLRTDTQVRSVLDDIPGVGPTRRKALLAHFKNIEAIRTAEIKDLSQVDSMNKASAEAVHRFFHTQTN
ncbi:MAG: excinuclease ABC subunit UvrC [Defluviitaleaceae bacterium]|nr:excinuclease ABC subunit UvrC [Defluviitaleaceae bacterium]MCL2239024.1 excinuclease ABC subunit UvrC [Defluviitaleaceae bacterium]